MEIVRKAAFKVVGLPFRAAPDQRWIEMPKSWKSFFARCDSIPHRVGETFIDVTMAKRDDLSEELLCSEVSRVDRLPDAMIVVEIPAQACDRLCVRRHGRLGSRERLHTRRFQARFRIHQGRIRKRARAVRESAVGHGCAVPNPGVVPYFVMSARTRSAAPACL